MGFADLNFSRWSNRFRFVQDRSFIYRAAISPGSQVSKGVNRSASAMSELRLLFTRSQPNRGRLDTSASGLGCVKSQKSKIRSEISSRLRQFEKRKRWRPLSGEDNGEKNSARFSRVHVFTQPRPIGDLVHHGNYAVAGGANADLHVVSSFSSRAMF
jgi:hypothetical protein